jgi:hypothetical protein
MSYALTFPGRLSHLIVADIAPSVGNLSSDFIKYISLMQEIESLPPGTVKTRSDADKILASHEPVSHVSYFSLSHTIRNAATQDMSIRQFLLTNLQVPNRSQTSNPHHDIPKFNISLDNLSKSIPSLGSFPYEYNEKDGTAPVIWNGPTLAIKGTKSS